MVPGSLLVYRDAHSRRQLVQRRAAGAIAHRPPQADSSSKGYFPVRRTMYTAGGVEGSVPAFSIRGRSAALAKMRSLDFSSTTSPPAPSSRAARSRSLPSPAARRSVIPRLPVKFSKYRYTKESPAISAALLLESFCPTWQRTRLSAKREPASRNWAPYGGWAKSLFPEYVPSSLTI